LSDFCVVTIPDPSVSQSVSQSSSRSLYGWRSVSLSVLV